MNTNVICLALYDGHRYPVAQSIAAWLSERRGISKVGLGPASSSTRVSHTISFAAKIIAKYLDSHVENATEACFLDSHMHAASPSLIKSTDESAWPDSKSWEITVPRKPYIFIFSFVPVPTIPLSLQASFTYWRKQFFPKLLVLKKGLDRF